MPSQDQIASQMLHEIYLRLRPLGGLRAIPGPILTIGTRVEVAGGSKILVDRLVFAAYDGHPVVKMWSVSRVRERIIKPAADRFVQGMLNVWPVGFDALFFGNAGGLGESEHMYCRANVHIRLSFYRDHSLPNTPRIFVSALCGFLPPPGAAPITASLREERQRIQKQLQEVRCPA